MVKYKVGDIFINHNDGKILQVCKGNCNKGCYYYHNNKCKGTFCIYIRCECFIGLHNNVKKLPSLPLGTKVKIKEDLKVETYYGNYTFVAEMKQYKEVTIKHYYTSHRCYQIYENDYIYSLEMFNQVINEPKINNMETKEIKIDVPEGYEIDEEKSTFECIKFKPVKKELTYEDVAKELFSKDIFATNMHGEIVHGTWTGNSTFDKNNATTCKQLEKLLALNQLLNIAEYYNKKNPKKRNDIYCISLNKPSLEYDALDYTSSTIVRSLIPIFNNIRDAQEVIDNPNFREILDTIYK